MGDQNDEIERIRRIRERQLRARDPKKAERKRDQIVGARYKKKTISFGEVLGDIPARWWGMIIGGIVGFVLAFVLDQVLKIKLPKIDAFWVEYLWYTLVFFGVAIGRALAMAMDWREEDHDSLVIRGRR